MKKLMLTFTLLGAAALLSACSLTDVTPPIATFVPEVHTVIPALQAPESLTENPEAILYYRYGSEPYLGYEVRTVVHQPSEPYEMALIRALLQGPGTRSGTLTNLFPDGVKVIATSRQGSTLFVTLSA